MANWDLVNYIEMQLSQGYTYDQIKVVMLKSGHNKNDISDAIKEVKRRYTSTSKFKQMQTEYFTYKNPWTQIILYFLTGTIYFFIWLARTSIELQKKDKKMVNPWFMLFFLIPLAGILAILIYLWRLASSVSHISGYNKTKLYALLIFLNPVGVYIAQRELNKYSLRP